MASFSTVLRSRLCRVVLAGALIAAAIPVAALPCNTAHAAGMPTQLVNGSFEYGPSKSELSAWAALSGHSGWVHVFPKTGRYGHVTLGQRPIANWNAASFGWSTNDPDDAVEEQTTSDWSYGTRHAELVADHAGSYIYQDISTVPGAVYKWRLKHGASGATGGVNVDRMSVMIGTVSTQTAQVGKRIASNGVDPVGTSSTVLSSTCQPGTAISERWNTYEGTYLVPSGQTVTRFTFKSIASVTTNSGNRIDDISFVRHHPLLYDLNGGTAPTLNTTLAQAQANGYAGYFREGSNKALSTTKPTRSGYTFLGWSKTDYGDITSKAAWESVKGSLASSLTMTAGTNTVHAVWGKNPTVTFSDGKPDPTVMKIQTVPFGSDAAAPATPTRTGYTCTGWDKSCSGIYADTTVTARWRANTYRIVFDANGGDGSMPAQPMTYQTSSPLAKNRFSSAVSSWQRWNTRADGSGASFSDGQSVSDLTSEDGGTVTLFAQWAIDPTVTFQDGWGTILKEETIPSGSSASPPAEPSRTGYTFKGWDGAYAEVTNDVTIYAEWERNPYAIAFDGNGATGSMDELPMEFDRAQELPLCRFQKAGYRFAGWITDQDGIERTFQDGQTVVNLSATAGSTVTLRARWLPKEYTISFEGNGAEGTMNDLRSSGGAKVQLPSCAFTFPGKSFQGWSLSQDGPIVYPDNASADDLLARENETVILYAIWEENAPVLITYHSDDPTRLSVTRDADVVAPLSGQIQGSTALPKTGYVFDRWVNAEGEAASTTTSMLPGRNADGLYEADSFTAESHPISYTVRYEGNGGSGSMSRTRCTYGEPATVANNGFDFPGKRFCGWSIDLSGHGRTFDEGESILDLTSDDGAEITLHALWEDTPPQDDAQENPIPEDEDTAPDPEPEEDTALDDADDPDKEEDAGASREGPEHISLDSGLDNRATALVDTGYAQPDRTSGGLTKAGSTYDKTGDVFGWAVAAFAILLACATVGIYQGTHRSPKGRRQQGVRR